MEYCWSPLACFLLALLLMISTTYAYDFYPGGSDGWVEKPSESYNVWAGRTRFQLHDNIVFKYKKGEDSVLLVSRRDYDLCNLKNPIKKLDGGDSVFHFDRSGPFFFVSGKSGSCTKGQKLLVVVMAERKKSTPVPTPPPASPPTPAPPYASPTLPPSPSPSPYALSLPPSLSPSPSAPSPSLSSSPSAPSPSLSSSEAPSPSPLSSPSSSEAPSPSLSSKSPSSSPNAPSLAPTPAAPPSSPSSSPNAPLLAPTSSSGYVTTFSRLTLAVLVVFLGSVVLV